LLTSEPPAKTVRLNLFSFFSPFDLPSTLRLGELKHQAQAFGLSLLEKHDLKAGDVVMLNAPNSVDWAIVFMATQFVGLKVSRDSLV